MQTVYRILQLYPEVTTKKQHFTLAEANKLNDEALQQAVNDPNYSMHEILRITDKNEAYRCLNSYKVGAPTYLGKEDGTHRYLVDLYILEMIGQLVDGELVEDKEGPTILEVKSDNFKHFVEEA